MLSLDKKISLTRWKTFYYLAFLFYATLVFRYVSSFELGWNELYEVLQLKLSPLDSFNPFSIELYKMDWGFSLPFLLKLLPSIYLDNLITPRIIIACIYIFSLHLNFLVFRKLYDEKTSVLATIFLALNLKYFEKALVITPYSLDLCFTILLYYFHFNFKQNKKSFFLYNVILILNIATYFTSALPIAISLALLYRNNKSFLIKYFYYMIPFAILFSIKFYMVIVHRLIMRTGGPAFDNLSVLQNLSSFLQIFNIYLPPAERLFGYNGVPMLYEICTYVNFLLIVCFFIYLFLRRESKVSKFLKIYFIMMIASWSVMKMIGMKEIEVRYYFGILPLLYIEMSYFLLKIVKFVHIKQLQFFGLLSLFYVKYLGIYILMYFMLVVPTISIHQKIEENLNHNEVNLFCLMGQNNFFYNTYTRINEIKNDLRPKSMSSCKNFPDKKTSSFDKMIFAYLGDGGESEHDYCYGKIEKQCVEEYFDNYKFDKNIIIERSRNNFSVTFKVLTLNK